MSEFSDAIQELLWRDVSEVEEYPTKRPLLAHYTSMESLEKIAISNELWLSNPLYMNDWEELQFGINAGATSLRNCKSVQAACGSSDMFAYLLEQFESFYSTYAVHHVIDTYVLCFSEHDRENTDGVLSMWRGYGAQGGGVAIVFDTSAIDPEDSPSPLMLGKVKYLTTQARKDWIADNLEKLATLLKSYPITHDNLHYAAYFWFERLKMFALFTKHIGFSEEREWRLVCLGERDNIRALEPMRGYYVSAHGVEPKLKLRIQRIPGVLNQDYSLERIVHQILLGPTASSDLSLKSIGRMLALSGLPALSSRILSSTIPYRQNLR